MIDVAVQILSYHSEDQLRRCVPSLVADLTASGLTYHVVVLDNGTGDDLESLTELAPDPSRLTLVRSERNLGFSAGHNHAFEHAPPSTATMLLTPDCRFVEPDTVLRLVHALRTRPRCVAVAPQLFDERGVNRWDHGELSGWKAWLARRAGGSYSRTRSRAAPVAWLNAAALLVSSAAFGAVGGFDEEFFHYKVEEDLCLRWRHQGHSVWYEPKVRVYNENPPSTPERDVMKAEGTSLYIDKHIGRGPVHRISHRLHHGLQLWH